jgi:hypothetical protein
MKLTTTLSLTLSLLLPILTTATPEFANHGTLSGWTRPKPEADGTVSEVTNVVYRGTTALKMTQTYKPGYTGRYHSEVVYKNGYKRGDTKFYGFAFRLSESWDFINDQSYNIAQWIADFTNTGCDDWSPTSMVYLRGSTLYSRIKTGRLLAGQACQQNTRQFALKTGIVPGQWYKLTFQVRWESEATGQFKVWVNGEKVHEEYDIATTLLDDRRQFDFRVGLYANGWHDSGFEGGNPFRQVWIDEVGVGSAFIDADPDRL